MNARVLANERETPTTRRLRLALDGEPFGYRAGQAASLAVADVPPAPYSIASSPAETREHGWLEFLIKIDGASRFGATAERLARDAVVTLDGPMGGFTLDAVTPGTPLLFIAGGTGIAPLRSMIRDAIDRGRRGALSLLYSNRLPGEFAYLAELKRLASDGLLTLSLTLTGEADDWTHARGRAGISHLAELVQEGTTAFICGPPAMVRDLPEALASLGVRRVVTESW